MTPEEYERLVRRFWRRVESRRKAGFPPDYESMRRAERRRQEDDARRRISAWDRGWETTYEKRAREALAGLVRR